MIRRTFAILAICTLITVHRPLLCQEPHRAWATGSLGIGFSTGKDVYRGGLSGFARAGVAVRFGERFGLEADVRAIGILSRLGYADPIPGFPDTVAVYYRLAGVSGSVHYALSRKTSIALGAGGYKITADPRSGQDTPNATALGLSLGIETRLERWSWGAVTMAIRPLVLPSVRGEPLFMVPIEIGLQLGR